MKTLSVLAMASAAVLALSTTVAVSQPAHPGAPLAAGPGKAEPDLAGLQRSANGAQARLQSNSQERLALARAAKAKNLAEVRSLLIREGFTPEQANGAQLSIEDQTGGRPADAAVRVTIQVSCCPLRIIITIRF